MENGAEDGLEMRAVPIYSFEEDEEYVDFEKGPRPHAAADADVDGEYGERTLAPRTVTKDIDASFYRASVMRQNRLFGVGVFVLAGMFVAAYFLMGLSFTPSNIGIFGDESSMRGGSGDVGLDADNAKTQSIVDEEVVELEESEHWGEMGNTKEDDIKAKILDRIKSHDKVGKHDWVFDEDWWEEHAPDMDVSKMTEKTKREYIRMKNKEEQLKMRCKKHPDNAKCGDGGKVVTDLESIKEKLAHHYDIFHKDEHGAAGVADAAENGPGDVANDENNEAGVPTTEVISEGTSPGGADGVAENVVDEVAEDPEETEQPADDVAGGGAQDEGQIQTSIVGEFTVMEQVGHDSSSFVQGLSYCDDGWLYETSGLNGQSKVRRIDPATFDVDASADLESQYFGEGSTCYRDAEGNLRLITLTWLSRTGFIYDPPTLERLSEYTYETTPPGHEGWGITYDGSNQEFIVSDGSTYLYFWDRDTLAEKRRVSVTRLDGSMQNQLNELEYMDGLVCCNIWHSDEIICVDPMTGKSVREYDMSSLWPKAERGNSENVLNGIALGRDHVLLTGKRWDRMYKVVFPDWPTLFESNTASLIP